MFSIAFSSLFGQDAARGISGEPYLRATSTHYPPLPGPPRSRLCVYFGYTLKASEEV
jgi:hypothetical protein